MNPEHIHLLVNHIPIHGLAVASFILLLGLALKHRMTVGVASLAVFLTALSIPVVMGTGEAAYQRYKQQPEIRDTLTDKGLQFAHVHFEQAEKGSKATYLLIVVGVLTLVCWKFKPNWFMKLGWALFLLTLICLILNVWIASTGGKIRRPDFQAGSVPTNHLDSH